MFSKKFVLACLVVALGSTFSAVQSAEVVDKAVKVEAEMAGTQAAMLGRLHQRVVRFCGPHQFPAGLNESLAAESCRADLINELTFKATDIQLIHNVPELVRVDRRRIVASSAPAF